MATRKLYPSDVSDEEWEFVAPYLALIRNDVPQRDHDLREVFNGLRWVVRAPAPRGATCPTTYLPPWEAVYQQTQRWLKAEVFEEMVHDLRVLLRLSEGRSSDPTAAILDSRTLRSTPESGSRGGYDGGKRKKGSKVHAAVDTLGHLLALRVSPASEQERGYVGELAEAVQEEATGESVELAYVDQGYTGERAAEATSSSKAARRRSLGSERSHSSRSLPSGSVATVGRPFAGTVRLWAALGASARTCSRVAGFSSRSGTYGTVLPPRSAPGSPGAARRPGCSGSGCPL
jgi:transposase